MKRRWALARRTSRAARSVAFAAPRLVLETLEDRRLLASFSDLSLDQSQHSASSLIVQFKDGSSSPGSLAAYLATAHVNSDWALTPGMRRVDLDSTADWSVALSAFKQDPNVVFAEPDYHVSLQLEPNDP